MNKALFNSFYFSQSQKVRNYALEGVSYSSLPREYAGNIEALVKRMSRRTNLVRSVNGGGTQC